MTPADLKSARKRLGFTQAQMADALRLHGLDRTRTVRAWEAGERPISGPVEVAVEAMLREQRREEARAVEVAAIARKR